MSQRNILYTNPEPCQHLADYKLKHSFKPIQKLLVIVNSPNCRTTVRKPNTEEIPRCSYSENGCEKRLFLCLICSSFCCLDHTLLHLESENSHALFVDIERAELFCGACRDQVYDPDFDQVVLSKHSVCLTIGATESIGQRLVKRRKLDSGDGLDLQKSNFLNKDLVGDVETVTIVPRGGGPWYIVGLRGFNNLGSTCFMNSVLQALLYALPFRDYFLNDGHSLEDCKEKNTDGICMLCEVNDVFTEVFSGDPTPYSPAQFLYSWWKHSPNLASYEQQDAHEFFLSILDAIHEKEGNTNKTRKRSRGNQEGGQCECIAHRVFYGLLRSDVTCMTCGSTSTTYDPFADISLNLNTDASLTEKGKELDYYYQDEDEDASTSTLKGCLDLFTRPEKLGSEQKLYCRSCKKRQNSMKQMSIKKLPLVLSLHVKRFEHSFANQSSRKIDSYVPFPFSLDMTPYMSSSILRTRYGNRIFAFGGDESDICSKYEIFAVVTHSGMLEAGHYVCFKRVRKQWYRCDDACISEVDEETVRALQCYMVFYVQQTLYDKVNEDPAHSEN